MSQRLLRASATSLGVFVLVMLAAMAWPQPGSAAPAAAPAVGAAPDDRELSTPVGWRWYYSQTAAGVNFIITSTNSRLVDIDVAEATPVRRFNAAFVDNSGPSAKTTYWTFDVTDVGVNTFLLGNSARVIAIKAYLIAPGSVRFAVVAVDNTGINHKNTKWWWGTQTAVENKITSGDRLVQLSSFLSGTQTLYATALISNTGADYRPWWRYYNITPAQLSSFLNTNNARPYDLDHDPQTGNINVIMTACPCPFFFWYTGLTPVQLAGHINQNGARITDFTGYPGCGDQCFDVILNNNVDDVSARVGHALRSGINGADGITVAVGLYLKQVGGPELAALEPDFAYQPASSIKVVEHLYAMRRVQAGSSLLSDPVVHYTNGEASCPEPPVVSGTEPLTTALGFMMRRSDNARTREISDTFGVKNFNFLMTSTIGMSSASHLGEIIGCTANTNRFTLHDAGKLYEGVADGSLLSGQSREDFYYLMAGKEQYETFGYDWTHIWYPQFDQIISQERPPAMTTPLTTTYKSKMRLNYKAGGYTFCQGTCSDVREYLAVTGLAQIPFCSGSTTTLRQFAFGIFLHGPEDTSWFSGKNTLADQTFFANTAEVLREQIHAGLASCFFQTWLPLIMR